VKNTSSRKGDSKSHIDFGIQELGHNNTAEKCGRRYLVMVEPS